MSTHGVATKCKICKKDLVVQIDNDYFGPLDNLLAMATCNRCYDLREKHLKATANIESGCNFLVQHPEASEKELEKARKHLEKWTKEYADAIRQFNHSDKLVWSEDFAQNLMQQPDKWYEQLRFYRQSVREQIQLAGISPQP